MRARVRYRVIDRPFKIELFKQTVRRSERITYNGRVVCSPIFGAPDCFGQITAVTT